MNAILGLTAMLSETELTDKQNEFLTKIQSSANVMLDLINDILDFSKIESGKMELILEYFNLHQFIGKISEMYTMLMQQKNLGFNTIVADDIPMVVYGDSKRLRQILNNILNNAYKYTPSGWVTLNVSMDDDGDIIFAISDTGIGIKEEDLPKLFGEFVQLDIIKNKNIAGTGLGLAITNRLVKMMDGRVDVESVYGKGSTFILSFRFPTGTENDLPASEVEAKAFTAKGAKVLVVDDIEINLEIILYMLERYEMDIFTASDGQIALDMASENDYDLIFMDHMMPRMDGIESTQLIRKLNGSRGKVKIVALTANAVEGMEKIFMNAGFDGFLSKPIEENVLARSLLDNLPPKLIHFSE
jgi:CheY-like chemotaxis protein/anti-sigma regulatory factor (Ser/Thr protein kinase)